MPLRILVVDDEREVRELLVDMLADEGHVTLEAADGPAALAMLADGVPVDLVLTDLGMPRMTGWELARRIRETWPAVMVGVITGWGEDAERAGAERQAATFVLAKPFSIQKLRDALARLGPGPRGP
jgi:CheY-like chemotaxis protein